MQRPVPANSLPRLGDFTTDRRVLVLTAMAILVPCAVLSAVVAALVPSLRLGRLDVIGAMRGQSVSPRLNRVLPVVGLVAAALGGTVVVTGARMQSGGDIRVTLGAFALVLGTLLVVPALLVGVGAVYGGFHYGVDILAGAALGALTSIAAIMVYRGS